jgi:micrococcal nuclease
MRKKRVTTSITLLILITLTLCLYALQGGPGRTATYRVRRVIDGDTIVLNNRERLRYIGIDTPELGHRKQDIRNMAEIAKQFNKELVGDQEILLEYDVEVRDRYGRLLAYVFLKDGTFVNAELVRQGYALIMTITPNVKYADRFLRLQREARQAKRGFWSDEYADFETMRKGY